MTAPLLVALDPFLPLRGLEGTWAVEERSYGLDRRPTEARGMKIFVRRGLGGTALILGTGGTKPEEQLIVRRAGKGFVAWSFVAGLPRAIEWTGGWSKDGLVLEAKADLDLRLLIQPNAKGWQWTLQAEVAGEWLTSTQRTLTRPSR
ncbi:MAG: hypothetical protein K1X67_02410 [Fimbriimonadaceae bacterium]|nr:hypothetical protein [Fimbriimonadaceae bacterium]